MAQATIGVIGGSGLYRMEEMTDVEEVRVQTPFGDPSDTIAIGKIGAVSMAFLPRHGRGHRLSPTEIPVRANIWALKSLGVSRVLAPSAVGSLQAHIAPGDFVIVDQFIDRTSGRADTFYDGPVVTHVSSADVYCPQLRSLAIDAVKSNGVIVHEAGTSVVIQGPRFSSRAESVWFTRMGWDVVTMTQYPEVILARELSLCYLTIGLVTDYDAGTVVEAAAVEAHNVLEVLAKNTANVKNVLRTLLSQLPESRTCPCADSLKYARME